MTRVQADYIEACRVRWQRATGMEKAWAAHEHARAAMQAGL